MLSCHFYSYDEGCKTKNLGGMCLTVAKIRNEGGGNQIKKDDTVVIPYHLFK